MSSTSVFYGLALTLVAGVIWVLVRALRAGQRASDPSERLTRANAEVYREQSLELDRERDLGTLSETEWAAARADLEQRLLQDVQGLQPTSTPVRTGWTRATIAGLVLVVPLGSLVMYGGYGQPAALDPQVRVAGMPEEHVTPEKIERMGAELRARLAKNPDQVEDWVMLARVERALDHFDAAQMALGRALKLSYNPDWAIERAEMLASHQQGRFEGEPWQIIESVLRTDPEHLGALLLAGSASYAESRYPQALTYWQKASDLVPPQSPDRQPLDAALGEVRAKLGLPDPRDQALAATAIRGRVSLGPAAKKAVQAEDTVFIYATLPDSRMPLAILRVRAADLPYDFRLDDRNAMNPQARLSQATSVVLRARISKSGQAQAQPDDWGVEIQGVKPGAQGLQLVIHRALGAN